MAVLKDWGADRVHLEKTGMYELIIDSEMGRDAQMSPSSGLG